MGGSIIQTAGILLATGIVGVVIGWLLRSAQSKQILKQQLDEWQVRYDSVVRHRDRLGEQIASLQTSIEAQQSLVHNHELAATQSRTALASEREKTNLLTKDLFTVRAERDELKGKLANGQNELESAKRHSAELESEFIKSGDIYKAELAKAFEKRKQLENKIRHAELEHESLSNLLEASRSEHESVNKMLAAAQTRLENIDVLEQNAIVLEADNAQLRHDAEKTKQEIKGLQRDIAELEELKVQNKELAHCLRSMENSRKQYEADAKRYREHAGQSEKQSETLRVKLDDVEKNFAAMEKHKHKLQKDVRKQPVAKPSNGIAVAPPEIDDLTKIVGIGKVFQQTLHELGIFSYRQIATFGVSDISRVNSELKEFKGRMEQDDWIGQAKDLCFQKYGETG